MNKFFYPHTAVITRETGETDDIGNPLVQNVSSGIACYQKPNSSNMQLALQYGADATLMIPDTKTIFKINDDVLIVVENNVQIKATVKDKETNTETGIAGTTLWLKNAQ